MSEIHKKARALRSKVEGFLICKDDLGRTGFTKLHEKGHRCQTAAIARGLDHAAAARKLTPPWRALEHSVYIDRVRQIRKKGTWL